MYYTDYEGTVHNCKFKSGESGVTGALSIDIFLKPDYPITLKLKARTTDWWGTSVIGLDEKNIRINGEFHPPKAYLVGDGGTIKWLNLKPSTTNTKDGNDGLKIRNDGEAGSTLNWKIENCPSWGHFSFSQSNGALGKSNDWFPIEVTVVAPSEYKTTYTGEIKIVNLDDPDNKVYVPVRLETSGRSKSKTSLAFTDILQFFNILRTNLKF